jgi:hypothetical protein
MSAKWMQSFLVEGLKREFVHISPKKAHGSLEIID